MAVTQQEIANAVAILRHGGLVAFPTETVYGLGADAANVTAVARIFAVKGRPQDHPLIVHVDSAHKLEHWASDIPSGARELTDRFWPGPLTLVLRRNAGVKDIITGGQNTVGIRCPSHPVAQQLLREFGGGVAAPSANRFGRISPTTAAHVKAELGDQVDLILDGGQSEVGLESTILDLSGGAPVLLRPGHISVSDIEVVLGVKVGTPDALSPRASGMLESHYAPNTPITMLQWPALIEALDSAEKSVGVLAMHRAPAKARAAQWIVASDKPHEYAHDLYANLRALDAVGLDQILVEAVPETKEWHAVLDRLTRACHRE